MKRREQAVVFALKEWERKKKGNPPKGIMKDGYCKQRLQAIAHKFGLKTRLELKEKVREGEARGTLLGIEALSLFKLLGEQV